uniref:VLIG3 n=1 Tax=Macrobrachium rosenbergii TaxID=79674 RepID=A0A173GTS0_MACRS|nr:VLIG3 [Macrobrachium rosenbergii]
MNCDDQPLPDEDTTHSLTDESSRQDAFILNYGEMEESSWEEGGTDLGIGCEETEDSSTERQKEIIGNLGLTQYFEENEEISVQTAMVQSSSQRDAMSDIPWFVLLKLLMLDYRGRDDILSDVIRNSFPTAKDVPTDNSGYMGGLDDIFLHLDNETSLTAQSHLPHPTDVLTALILCSSNFLRQILCEKLYMCKLSIPLIIPSVLNRDSMFLLWSLRSTILEHRLPSGELCETSVVKCRIPIVSCLRLGEISRSKSRFLNEIISDQNHPTFFHRDCLNGMCQRILSEGALEISWYYPVEESRDNDCLGRNVAIMNLRGDGNLSLQPSCIFVHQNVSAQDASQKLRGGQQKFMETLDKVTEAAGKQEDSPDYTRFRQVINFDIDTDICYISDLWKGDPPMAPANPGYSENVNKIKQILLKRIMIKRPLHLTIGQFSARLKDIWDGVLDQNFVFSFRNSLEMDAYYALENEQSDISWMLKSAEMKWFNSKRNLIENRENELGALRLNLTAECRSHLEQVYRQAREKLENYFLNNEYQSLFEQWRVSAMLRLEASYRSIVEKAVENINTEISKRRIKINEKKDMQTNITKIMDEAKKLAGELQLRNDINPLGEEELRESFNAKWTEWMDAIPQNTKENLDVQREIDHILDNAHTLEFTLLNKARKERHHTIVLDNFGYAIEKYILEKTAKASFLHFLTNKHNTAIGYLKTLLEKVKYLFSNEGSQITPEGCAYTLIDLVREEMQKMKSDLKFKNEEEFEICIIVFTWQYACFVYHRFLDQSTAQHRRNEMVDNGIHPVFEEVLLQYFPDSATKVTNQIRTWLTHQRSSRNFAVITKKHIKDTKIGKEEARAHIQELVNVLFEDVQSYIDEIEIQCFRELYIEKIIRKLTEMESQCRDLITLTKTFRNELAVYLCQFSVPMFCDKHKAYIESMDQRLIYKRENYGPCFESFANFYYRSTNEQALASVLSEYLYNAIEKAIRVNLRTDLVEDIRNNVSDLRLKPSFLRAVLRKLLEKDDFEEFYLYLTDRDACLQQWLSYFIDQYLFASERDGLNRYTEIAFRNIERLISVSCEMIVRPLPSSSEKSMDSWFEEFIQRVTDKLPLPVQDLLSLADGYEIVSLESFVSQLSDKIRNCQEKLKATFKNHTPDHQKAAHENNIYKLIANECKGCTEKCPFCYAPCSLNTCGHTDSGIDHVALAHHPQACGKYRERISSKLSTESCEALVASNVSFACKENNWKPDFYKDYKKIFPDWKIQGDASTEATPYWKWFLVKYERQLAERYRAERPDIPTSWKNITEEAALKSLEH